MVGGEEKLVVVGAAVYGNLATRVRHQDLRSRLLSFLDAARKMTKLEAPDQMSKRLLEGWTMLDQVCEDCKVTPLMRSRDGKVECGTCITKVSAKLETVKSVSKEEEDLVRVLGQRIEKSINSEQFEELTVLFEVASSMLSQEGLKNMRNDLQSIKMKLVLKMLRNPGYTVNDKLSQIAKLSL